MPDLPSPRTGIILGVPFHDVTMDETLGRLAQVIDRRDPVYWATANLDFAYQASNDVELQRILIEADLVLCDGTPLVWASRALGAPLRERVTGSDLVPRMANEAAARGWKLFLLGGGEDALPIAMAKLRAQHPGILIDGYSPPYAKLLEMDFETIAARIAEARPDVLLVAFGCPKQEKWIYMHYRQLGVPLCVGVGATVDFLAGKFRRAPRWMQVIGAEWIFRFSQEPRRLFNRYLFDLLFFVRALRAQRRALAEGASRASSTPAAPTPPAPAPVSAVNVQLVRWHDRVDAAAIAAGQVLDPAGQRIPGMVVALDTAGVTFLDSTGLGLLISAYRRAAASGGGLVLVRPSSAVTRLLAAVKLNRLIPIAEDAASAPAALGLRPPAPCPQTSGDGLTLLVQGELIAQRVPELLRWIESNWEQKPGATRLVLDLSAVRFMDSSGLGLLLRCLRLVGARNDGTLTLLQPHSNVRNVLRLAKVESLFTLA